MKLTFDPGILVKRKTRQLSLLTGKNSVFPSTGEMRRAIIVAELSIITIVVNFLYLVLDFMSGFHNTLFIYLLVIFVALLAFYLNRNNFREPAKTILIYALAFSVFLFGSSNLENTQVYVFYFPLVIISFTFFGPDKLWKSLLFSGLVIVLFLVDHSTDFSIIKPGQLSEAEASRFVIVNYSIAIAATVYVSYFLVKTNFLSEEELREHQKELNIIAERLRESQERYELAITGTHSGLWDWDIMNNTIYHAAKWKEMLGYSEEELSDISINDFYEFVHPEDVDMVKSAVKNHLDKKEPFNIEYRIKNKNGEYRWFYDSGQAVLINEEPVRMVGSIVNVDDRKKAEEEIKKQKDLLEKANAELDRFVYITSHDLKAPLLSIQGLINLAEISDSKEEIHNCLQMMKERVKGLEKFISDIIDYSRNVRSGIIKEQIQLKSLVKEIIEELMYLKDMNKLNIIIDIPAELSLISDEKRLNIILKNLLYNAIKYHHYQQDKPEIIIKAIKSADEINIHVIDNGEGIKEEQLNKIFDMFYRASEKSNGSGLGLYIVNEMVNKLNGSIHVESEYGKGSDFSIRLPASY